MNGQIKHLKLACLLSLALITPGGARPTLAADADVARVSSYCNPMNLDYAFVPDKDYSHNNNRHRSTADPACILYKDKYFLFASNQEGYWWSYDLAAWHFVSHKFALNGSKDQICAPAAWPTDKGVLLLPSFEPKDIMPLYISTNPERGKWREAVPSLEVKAWDPALFQDDDKRLYIYWDSSNIYPIYGVELDPDHGYCAKGKPRELLHLSADKHGWEQFGENNQNGSMDPFIEGAWMNKFDGRYYLQYAAPGTEFNVYGDGVYVSDHPLGPFVYQQNSPFSFKPTGFIRGAGHGSTFEDKYGNLWHAATMVISVKNTFERRLGLFPTGLDKDGVLHTDTAFGDYPHFIPQDKHDPDQNFCGWTLLSYHKRCWASDSKKDPALAFDEDIKTYWSADNGAPGRFLAVDLGQPCEIRAIQINYADEQASVYGKQKGKRHRYQIFQSGDGEKWELLVDKSKNDTEVPHDYVELPQPVKTQFLKLVNIEMPTGYFAVGDLRVFGKAPGPAPDNVTDFAAARDAKDRRNVTLTWRKVPGAYAYNISFGVMPDKLYSSMLIYDLTAYQLHSLNTESPYYFKIQAVSESGISADSAAVKTE
jgi:hypothetical protein